MINRPLDFLNELKDKDVIVSLKDKEFTGTLLAFDIHINLVLDNAKGLIEGKKIKLKEFGITFLRGDNIVSIREGGK